MAPQKVTVQEFAEKLGVSRQAAYRAIARCGIPLVDGLVDLQVAVAVYRAKTRARVKSRAPAEPGGQTAAAPDPQTYEVSRAQREAAEARIAQLTLGQLNGTLLERAAVERGAFQAARGLRDRLENAAAQLGAGVAPLTQASDCEAVLRSGFRKLLFDFSGELAAMVGPPPAGLSPAAPAPAAEPAPQ